MNFELRVQRYDFFLIYAREVRVRKLEKDALLFLCCSLLLICGVFIGYSWGIHGVFICIGYVSVMCRLCIGYVSEHIGSEWVGKVQNRVRTEW